MGADAKTAMKVEMTDAAARRIRSTLNRYLTALAAAHAGERVFVCLSGGLDSSGIAALASEPQ